MENENKIDDFETVMIDLIKVTNRLKQFDAFGSTAILGVIQLLMSKSDEFVKLTNSATASKLNTPDEIKEEVNSTISEIRALLNSDD